jgi:hypothetical protein
MSFKSVLHQAVFKVLPGFLLVGWGWRRGHKNVDEDVQSIGADFALMWSSSPKSISRGE